MFLPVPTSLPEYVAERPDPDLLPWVRHGHAPWLGWVREVKMTALHVAKNLVSRPTIAFM